MGATPTEFLPDDVDSLLNLLDNDENEWADGAALYASFGLWDDKRKLVLSECALELRAGPPPKGATAWTDKLLDVAAHAHQTYKTFMADSEREAKRFRKLEARRILVTLKAKALSYNPVR